MTPTVSWSGGRDEHKHASELHLLLVISVFTEDVCALASDCETEVQYEVTHGQPLSNHLKLAKSLINS